MIDLNDELSETKADPVRRKAMIEILSQTKKIAPELAIRVQTKWTEAQSEGKRVDRVWSAVAGVHLTAQGLNTHSKMVTAGCPWDFYSVAKQPCPEDYLLKIVNNRLRGPKIVDAWKALGGRSCGEDVMRKFEERLTGLKGWGEKVNFFLTRQSGLPKFKGIGPKYARNIWLDWADEEVSAHCFALDTRVQRIIPVLWPDLANVEGVELLRAAVNHAELYQKIETALAKLAHDAGVSCWKADRTIFGMLDRQQKASRDKCARLLCVSGFR